MPTAWRLLAGVHRPGTLALPLVRGPRHLVLVVLGGAPRVEPDEIAAAGVVGGEVPRALQELVGAVGGTAGVVRLGVVAALVAAHAGQIRIRVVRAHTA